MQTKYQVVVRLETIVQQYHNEKMLDEHGNEVIVAENVMDDTEEYNVDIGEYIFLQHHRYSDDNKTKYLGYAKDNNGKVDDTKAFMDNTDEQCFVYSYENFLNGVNLALRSCTEQINDRDKLKGAFPENQIWFQLNNGLLQFVVDDGFFGTKKTEDEMSEEMGRIVYRWNDITVYKCRHPLLTRSLQVLGQWL